MQKKRIQKALVMLLAVVMILGMQPATVHAVDLAEEPTNEQQASTTAEPEDKETALPENEPDAEATTEESTLQRLSLRMQILKTVTPERARSPHRRLLLRKNPVQKHRRKPPLKQQPRRKARRRLLQSNP